MELAAGAEAAIDFICAAMAVKWSIIAKWFSHSARIERLVLICAHARR